MEVAVQLRKLAEEKIGAEHYCWKVIKRLIVEIYFLKMFRLLLMLWKLFRTPWLKMRVFRRLSP